ncbi:hypothetical protein TcCL_ESM09856, partial [Trypanosoma cruzi]
MPGKFQAEQTEVCLTCCFRMTMGGEQNRGRSMRWQQLVPCGIKIQTYQCGESADAESVTEGTQYGGGLPAEHRVVARISFIGGVTAEPSNQLDSDILLRLMGHFIAMAEQPSDSLVDIMAWRMGLS